MIKRWYWIVLWSWSVLSAAAPTSDWGKIALKPGETTTRRFQERSDLHVTRGKVIDLHHLGHGQWRITALKSGVVYIVEKDQEGQELARLLVEVDPADPRSHKILPAHEEGLPAWVCQREGVNCDAENKGVAGEIEDWQFFFDVAQICLLSWGCQNRLQLAPGGREALGQWLREQLGDVTVNVSPSGQTVVTAACDRRGQSDLETLVNHLTRGGVLGDRILVRCHEVLTDGLLLIKAHAILDQGGSEIDQGFDYDPVSHVPLGKIGFNVAPELHARLETSTAKVVGAPQLRLKPGSTGVVQGALEDSELLGADQLQVKVQTWRSTPGNVLVEYVLQLRHRKSDGVDVLQEMTSLVQVPVGKAMMMGKFDVNSARNQEREVPLLARIPVLGFFFQWLVKQEIHHQLVFWLEVQEDGGQTSLND